MRERMSFRKLLSPGSPGAVAGLILLASAFSLSLSQQTVERSSASPPWVSFRDVDRLAFVTAGAPGGGEVVARDLASGDMNEDGLLDLAVGYGDSEGGLVGLYTGSKTALFPGRDGSSISQPSLRPLAMLSVPEAAALIEIGDFDADGHLDVASAAWWSETLYLQMGRGDGTFEAPEPLAIPGRITAMLATPLRRADALPALILAVEGSEAPALVIYESARGARHAQVETAPLPRSAFDIASGYLDDGPDRDLVVAAGGDVLLFSGESLSEGVRNVFSMPARVMSLAVGDFLEDSGSFPDVAVLTADGDLSFLERRDDGWTSSETALSSVLDPVDTADSSLPAAEAVSLIAARVSSLSGDDVVVIDRAQRRIRVIHGVAANGGMSMSIVGSLALLSEPVAALPMRLSPDALDDLVILSADEPAPKVAKTLPIRTFVVNSSGDEDDYALEDEVCSAGAIDSLTGRRVSTNQCTLRAAISQANASPGADAIRFDVDTIDIQAPLPAVEEALLIDGSAASAVNLEECTQPNCLTLLGSSVVRGLTISGALEADILVRGGGNIVEGNRLGPSPSGRGVLIKEGSFNRIGGTVREAGNHIAGSRVGVEIAGRRSQQNRVLGNTFGSSGAEGAGTGTTVAAVLVRSSHNSVGGAEAGAGNVITGGDIGVWIDGADANAILGNTIGLSALDPGSPNLEGVRIGPDASHNALGGPGARAANLISGNDLGVRIVGDPLGGETAGAAEYAIGGAEPGQGKENGAPGGSLSGTWANQVLGNVIEGNQQAGILITGGARDNQIGDGSRGGSNEIAHNQGDGVLIESSPGNTVRANSIWSNRGLGIDAEGVETGSASDAVEAPRAPVLTRQTGEQPGSTIVEGTVSGPAGRALILDFYATEECDASGFGEGKLYLGSIQGSASGVGTSTPFSVELPVPSSSNSNITVTATAARGGTSTFSNCLRLATVEGSSPEAPPVPTPEAGLRVGDSFESPSSSLCVAPVELILTNRTISDTKTFEACETIKAGPDFEVLETGDVTLRAGNEIVWHEGFSIRVGASFVAVIDPNVTGDPAPVITDFDPKTATPGTLVSITGTNLVTEASTPTVTLGQQGGGSIEAPVASSAADIVEIVVPTGSATGPIAVSVGPQSDSTSLELVIEPSSDFTLTALPSAATLIQGENVTYTATLGSSNGFSQLAALSLSGLPAGATSSFSPSQIGTGQTINLTVSAPPGQPIGASTLTIAADATVDGLAVSATADITLNIEEPTTTFRGRTVVADTLQTSLAGVAVTLLGVDGNGSPTACAGTTVSDAAGNFALTNLPPGCAGGQLIRFDGSTAVSPPGEYAGVDLFYDLAPNQVTSSPVLVHLPRIDDAERVCVDQGSPVDQAFTFQTIPNLSIIVYAGTTFAPPAPSQRGCGPAQFPLTAVQVAVDRLPEEMPPSATTVMPFIVAFQPANTQASQPVAVSFPNILSTPPGTNMELSTLDPTLGVMVVYGTGTVSNDGTQVIPDLNPATPGRRFGLVHFDWHGQVDDGNDENPCMSCPCPSVGGTVDIASGTEVVRSTDIEISGLRGRIAIERTYRTLSAAAGPFGVGTNHNYGFRLSTNAPQSSALINLIMPDGNRVPFASQGGGTFANSTIPELLGAVMNVDPSGQTDLRWKNGTTFHFVPSTFALGSVLMSITDRNGNAVTLTRDLSRPVRITEVIDPVGRKLLLNHDGNDRITSITDQIGRQVLYTYNSQGTLETMTDPEGGLTQYGYTPENRLTQITDPRGVVIAQITYGSDGRVIQEVQADGGVRMFSYTLFNPLLPGSPVSQTVATDPLGRQTIYRFDPQGFLLDVTDTSGQTQVFEREPGANSLLAINGVASCDVCGSSDSGDVSFTHDANGNLLTRTDALGNTTTFTYEPAYNQVASITDSLGHTTSFNYDSTGNLLTRTDENGDTTTFAYDAFGLVTQQTDPLSEHTTFSYDNFGNLATVTDPLGSTTVFEYDGASRQVASTDALGRRTETGYDDLGRVTETVDAAGNTTVSSYDPVGNLLWVTDARGNTTSFSYDSMGRLENRTDSLGNSESRTYDQNGNLTVYVDRRGETSVFGYDELNRLESEDYQDGSTVRRSYDQRGRLARVDDSSGGIFSFSYDLANRLLESIGPFGTVLYGRDPLGRTTQRQVVGQLAVDYGYDAAGNLLSAVMPEASVAFTYDARDQLTGELRSNAVATDYTYDSAGRLLNITHTGPTGTLDSQSYTYDAVGNRIEKSSILAQPLMRLSSNHAPDSFSNRLLQNGSVTYTYDANGNRLTETEPFGTISYSWDSRNRLQSVVTSTESNSFRYDFKGNLIAQAIVRSGSSESQIFVLDQNTNVAYSADNNGGRFSVLTGQSIDDHFAVSQQSGEVEFGLVDAINSTVVTVDGDGATVGEFQYQPFGETMLVGSSYRFQYTGRVPVSGELYHYRARYYDTLSSRFISEDSVGVRTGSNLYAYVNGDPINNRDPMGLQSGESGEAGDTKLCQSDCVRRFGEDMLKCLRSPKNPWCIAQAKSRLEICLFNSIPEVPDSPPVVPCLPPFCDSSGELEFPGEL